MGRIINPEGSGKQRIRLTRSVVLALRELMNQNEVDGNTRDIAAYIAQALQAIADTVEESITPWEKRGYWVKADRFRMEWAWTQKLGTSMQTAVQEDDWETVAMTAAQVAEKLKDVKVPKRHQLGTPWVGAWEKINPEQTS